MEVKQFVKELRRVEGELRRARADQAVLWAINSLAKRRPGTVTPQMVDFTWHTCLASAGAAIRRQGDSKNEQVSLASLLTRLSTGDVKIGREDYYKLWSDEDRPRAKQLWQEINSGNPDSFNKPIVVTDLRTVREEINKIKPWVDGVIVHTDRSYKCTLAPSGKQAWRVTAVLLKVTAKYLKVSEASGLCEVIQSAYPWAAVHASKEE